MAFNNLIARTDAQALIPEQVSYAILQALSGGGSAAMSLFRHIPMATNQTRMPVLAALPTAYFVNGDTGLKQTTQVAWANKYINVEELACIVPVPENVLMDSQASGFDIWGAIQPLIVDAIGRALDAAVFFGVNKPASWPGALNADAAAAGNTIQSGTATAALGGIAEDINQTFATVEADGFDINGIVTNRTFRARLRSARDTLGQRLLDVQAGAESIEGVPIRYALPGLWPTGAGATELILGDFTQGILGVRQDITMKMLDQAVITDNTGAIVYNLPQQDMVALRVVFRVGFQVANTLNYQQQIAASRYPFAVLHKA